MDESKTYYWKGKDKKLKDFTKKELLSYYFFDTISPFLTLITRYFPFSLLWQDRRFHFKHKKMNDTDDLILKIAGEKGFWFKLISYTQDDNFLNVIGRFEPRKENANKNNLFQYFRKKMKDHNFYINDIEDNNVKITLQVHEQAE